MSKHVKYRLEDVLNFIGYYVNHSIVKCVFCDGEGCFKNIYHIENCNGDVICTECDQCVGSCKYSDEDWHYPIDITNQHLDFLIRKYKLEVLCN